MHAGPYSDNPLDWKAPAIGRMAPFLLFQCIFYWCVLTFIEADMFTGVRVRISTMVVRVKSMFGLCCRTVLPRRKVQPTNDDTRTHQKSISGIDDEDIVCDYWGLMGLHGYTVTICPHVQCERTRRTGFRRVDRT